MVRKQPNESHPWKSHRKGDEIKINDVVLTLSVDEKLLGITLDSDLQFEKHIIDISDKASQKIHVLTRITSYIPLNKRRLVMKTFVESLFNFVP